MNDFNWKEFKKDKIAVWCKTEEIAKDFLKECDKRGLKWIDGSTATSDTHYKLYGAKTCYTCQISYCPKGFFEDGDFKIIEWKLQEEYTFQEVIARIKPGEVYNCTEVGFNLKNIVCLANFNIRLDFANHDLNCINDYEYLIINSLDAKFRLQEPKKQCVLYGIEHKEDGKIYYFRNKGTKVIPDGSFVVCDTSQGKSYGRAVQRIEKELTEEEYLNYKECWRA